MMMIGIYFIQLYIYIYIYIYIIYLYTLLSSNAYTYISCGDNR